MSLRVEDIEAGYGAKVVISEVSFNLAPGEIMAFFGHNGAGKSTTLKTIMGLLKCRKGGVWLDDGRIDELSVTDRVARGLRLLPEGQGVFPDLDVAANLDIVAQKSCQASDTKINIEDVLRIFPVLAGRKSSLAGNMSGGQQRMLAVSLAILGSPRCILFEEPSVGLQPDVVEKLFAQMRDICKEHGMCAIVIEHKVAATMKIADHVVIMNNGRVAFDGSPEEAEKSDFWQFF